MLPTARAHWGSAKMDAGGLEQTMTDGETDSFQPAMDVQFIQNIAYVVAHSGLADGETASYFWRGRAGGQHSKHFGLSSSEFHRGVAGFRGFVWRKDALGTIWDTQPGFFIQVSYGLQYMHDTVF